MVGSRRRAELCRSNYDNVLQVDVFTAHHDRSRCFSETVDGSFPVIVAGAWFPRSILGKAHALCAYVRCLLVAMHIAWVSWRCAGCACCILGYAGPAFASFTC